MAQVMYVISFWRRHRLIRRCCLLLISGLIVFVLIAQLPLFFISRVEVIDVYRGGRLRVSVRRSIGFNFHAGRSTHWYFKSTEPSYGIQVGWIIYGATCQPSPDEVLEHLYSNEIGDITRALWCLHWIPNEDARDRLVDLLVHPHIFVRAGAAQALLELGDMRGLDSLIKDAKSSDSLTSKVAVATLQSLSPQEEKMAIVERAIMNIVE